MNKISVYIICFNEEKKIEAAILSVAEWADEVLIVDSFSTDRTLEICKKYPVKIIQVPFEGFGKLRNEAIRNCQYPWIFSLDADERCTLEAAAEILEIIQDDRAGRPVAYHVSRRNFFLGRRIRYSGWHPDFRQPQLFKKDRFKYTLQTVHEKYRADGVVDIMKNYIWQIPFNDLDQMMQKANRYSTLGAIQSLHRKRGAVSNAILHGSAAFLQTYFFKRGFLDGYAGFLIAFYNGISSFYKYAKLKELQKALKQNEPGNHREAVSLFTRKPSSRHIIYRE